MGEGFHEGGEGFHEGEVLVQQRAGVRTQAVRLAGMLAPRTLDGGPNAFLAQREFAVITGRDHEQRLWTSPLFAGPGFLNARDAVLRVHATPLPGDPLSMLEAGQPIGLLAIEFATRRRIRVNGTLTHAGSHELAIAVDQAYGNCPQYIQQRHLDHGATTSADAQVTQSESLTTQHIEQIAIADTFFLGTVHPSRGADASHRGGTPGFVRVEGNRLWWPDYSGNNMFNSLGNLEVDDSAALLFVDFDSGATLHLSGTAIVVWTQPGVEGDDGNTGRRVEFSVERIAAGPTLGIRSDAARPSPDNPPVT